MFVFSLSSHIKAVMENWMVSSLTWVLVSRLLLVLRVLGQLQPRKGKNVAQAVSKVPYKDKLKNCLVFSFFLLLPWN